MEHTTIPAARSEIGPIPPSSSPCVSTVRTLDSTGTVHDRLTAPTVATEPAVLLFHIAISIRRIEWGFDARLARDVVDVEFLSVRAFERPDDFLTGVLPDPFPVDKFVEFRSFNIDRPCRAMFEIVFFEEGHTVLVGFDDSPADDTRSLPLHLVHEFAEELYADSLAPCVRSDVNPVNITDDGLSTENFPLCVSRYLVVCCDYQQAALIGHYLFEGVVRIPLLDKVVDCFPIDCWGIGLVQGFSGDLLDVSSVVGSELANLHVRIFGLRTVNTSDSLDLFVSWPYMEVMSDTPTEESGRPEGSRMLLEPDTIHEEEGGIVLDCPKCGSTISIEQIVNEGRCDGSLSDEMAETEDDTQIEDNCNARLSLELVWEN